MSPNRIRRFPKNLTALPYTTHAIQTQLIEDSAPGNGSNRTYLQKKTATP
jgi:hypothetical protein